MKNQIFALTDCIDDGLVLSCHDIAAGGIAPSLSEMTFGNGIGCNVNIESNLSTAKILFSETGGFVMEASPDKLEKVQSVFSNYGLDIFGIGTTDCDTFTINNAVDLSVSEAKKAWANGLREKL